MRQLPFCVFPQITDDLLEQLYLNGFDGPEAGAPESGWADASFLDPVLPLLEQKSPLTILDFGTGQSIVPDVLRASGHRAIAVDLAPPLRPHPDRYSGNLKDLGLKEDYFDLAYSFQVLEHLAEPREYLEKLCSVVKPSGHILIHTDMEVSERDHGLSRWWYVTPPSHCAFYRHRTFELFAGHRGLEIVSKGEKTVVIKKYDIASMVYVV